MMIRSGDDGLSGAHRPGHVPHPRQGPGHGALLRPVRQRPPGQGPEGELDGFSSPDCGGGATAPPLQGLGGHDPQGLRGRPHGLSQMRRLDEGRLFPYGFLCGGPDHRPPQADLCRGAAPAASGRLSGAPDGR